MPSQALAWFGTAEPQPSRRHLVAGPLSAMFEDGALRWVRWRDREVLRGIAFVVRDSGWGTPGPAIEDLAVDQQGGRFAVTFTARCICADGRFRYRASIEGYANGTLHFSAEGCAEGRPLLTNRTGFVVLHPGDVAGNALIVTHRDGGLSRTRFPVLIAPHRPATEIVALHHCMPEGVQASCRFTGETFEMEDQRNWGDDSFKTYCRPLGRGFPYQIGVGETVRQAVTLLLEGSSGSDAAASVNPDAAFRMPRIGLAMDAANAPAALAAARHIRRAGVSRIVVRMNSPCEAAGLAACAAAFGVPLTLELVIPGAVPDAELSSYASAISTANVPFDEILPMAARDFRSRPTGTPAGEADAATIARAARAIFPGRRIVGGTPGFLTELNRNPPDHALFDAMQCAFCATVHAADDTSVIESLSSLSAIGASFAALAPGIERRLATATLAMRDSMDGPPPLANTMGKRMPRAAEDPRHGAGFGAAWATAFALHAGAAGIDLVAPATITGCLGLFRPGGVPTPLLDAIGTLARWSGRTVAWIAGRRGVHGDGELLAIDDRLAHGDAD